MPIKSLSEVIRYGCTERVTTAFHILSGRKNPGVLARMGLVSLLALAHSTVALAATAPPLGSATNFAIVSNTFTNSANPTIINGSVCYTTPPTTPPTTVTGIIKTPCDTEIADQGTALADLDSQLGACIPLGAAVDLSAVIVGGGTPGVIPPGCYSSTGAMSVGSTVTLNGPGVYVFRPGAGATTAALNTATGSIVTLNGGACAADVFWAPTAATTLGANSTFIGTVIGNAGMTMGAGATLTGRALTAGGTATTSANSITVPSACAVPILPTVTVSKVSNGSVGTFGFSGSNGFANQSITTVTSGSAVAGATQTLTTAGVSTTITEAPPPAGFTLASISCSGLGAGGTQTNNLVTRTVTLDAAATAAGAAIACTFTNAFAPAALPSITLTKISNGSVGTFGFSGSNGFANQSITTLTSGSAVTGATQTLTTAGVSTTITEAAPPAGFTLASISCTGLGAGGTQTPNVVTRTVTLDAAATAAGAAIACTFTNAFAPPTLPSMTLTKVSNGGVGTFGFSGSNGFANQSITTLTSGSAVTGATQTLTAAGVSTTITETAPPAGFTLASISCTGLGAGGTQTTNLVTRTVTLDAAAMAAGAAIACTFTNNQDVLVPPVTPIPTLSEWAMILLAGLLAVAGFAAMRRKGM